MGIDMDTISIAQYRELRDQRDALETELKNVKDLFLRYEARCDELKIDNTTLRTQCSEYCASIDRLDTERNNLYTENQELRNIITNRDAEIKNLQR